MNLIGSFLLFVIYVMAKGRGCLVGVQIERGGGFPHTLVKRTLPWNGMPLSDLAVRYSHTIPRLSLFNSAL